MTWVESTLSRVFVAQQSCESIWGMAKDQIPELRELRDQYDKARAALFAGIREQLRKQEPLAKIGRSVDWSSEYIAKIRDGKVND